MCQVLGVSRHNYYSAVRRNEQLEPDPQHDELIEWVQKIADASDFACVTFYFSANPVPLFTKGR